MKKRKICCYRLAISLWFFALVCLLPFNSGTGQVRKDISPIPLAPSKTHPSSEIRTQEPPKFTIAPGIESFTAEPLTINYGDAITLRWRFRSSYAGQLRVTVEGVQKREIYMSIIPNWKVIFKSSDPSKAPDLLEGTYTFKPKWRGYTDLKIRISHMLMDKVFKTFEETTRGRGIRVNSYNFEINAEIIQFPMPKVKFYIVNKAWQYGGPYVGRLRFVYAIKSTPHGSGPLNITASHDFGDVNLGPGEMAPTIEIPLKKKDAFATNSIFVGGTLRWVSPHPDEGEQSTGFNSSHTWVEKQGNLGDSTIILILNALLGNLKLHIHNYGKQESYVELPNLSFKKYFNIPEIDHELEVLWVHWGYYRIWIRDINNASVGQDAIAIAEGGIRVNIPVEAGGPTEVKCVYDPVGLGGYTDDNACPDLDLQGPINAKVVFIPAVVVGKFGYSHVNVDLTIGGINLTNVWDWFIQLFTGDIKPKIEQETEKALKSFLESSQVKKAFMDAVENLIPGVTRVTRIEVKESNLFYWYL